MRNVHITTLKQIELFWMRSVQKAFLKMDTFLFRPDSIAYVHNLKTLMPSKLNLKIKRLSTFDNRPLFAISIQQEVYRSTVSCS